jgi:putative toxin-antitoxin system antitoxin component (TIGR02293 family)
MYIFVYNCLKMKKKQHQQVESDSTLSEPMVAYGVSSDTPIALMMGYNSNPTNFDLLQLARKGVAKKTLLALAKKISLTIEEIACILHISERTLQRYEPETLIKTEYTDRAIELAQLYERGVEVLGTEEAFNRWIRTPNRALSNEIPLNLLDTSIGFTMVLQILGRIEYGVFS